jgi:hypothetical protein
MHISIVEIGQNQRREGDPNWYGTCWITNYEYTKQTLLRCWALLSLVVIRDALKNGTEDRVMKRLSLVAVFLLIISPAFADSIGLVVTDLTISHRLPTGSVFCGWPAPYVLIYVAKEIKNVGPEGTTHVFTKDHGVWKLSCSRTSFPKEEWRRRSGNHA